MWLIKKCIIILKERDRMFPTETRKRRSGLMQGAGDLDKGAPQSQESWRNVNLPKEAQRNRDLSDFD